MKIKTIAFINIICFAILFPQSAKPIVYHELSVSAYGVSLGGAALTLGGDPAAIYWNPALIAELEGSWFTLTGADWLSKLYNSPNYRIENGVWIPKTETTNWENFVFPISLSYKFDFKTLSVALAIMDIGGWREAGTDYTRQRFCVSYNACFAIKPIPELSLGINPKIVQMTDFKLPNSDIANLETHLAFGLAMDAGICWRAADFLSLGASIMSPFFMHWDDPSMVFSTGSTDGWEPEPMVLRIGFLVSPLPNIKFMADGSGMFWNVYDGSASNTFQYHLGFQAETGFLPIRLGFQNEPIPWNKDVTRHFLSTGTTIPLEGGKIDIAIELCIPSRPETDILHILTVSLSKSFLPTEE